MRTGIAGRLALVTAASRGLGFASTAALRGEGADLLICARDAARLEDAAAQLRAVPGAGRVECVTCDVADDEAGAALEAACASAFGRSPALLVCNAGGPPPGLFESLDDEAWRRGFDLSFLSTARLLRRFGPLMAQSGYGRIVTITSATVLRPLDGLTLSNVVRPAVAALVREVAPRWAPHGVTVNNVAPGFTRTERVEALVRAQAAFAGINEEAARATRVAAIPAGRMGEPDEFAAVVTFLCSEPAGYVTGQTIAVDGGFSIPR
jgi:3-oxoacyl-[acyl-carrier protein] reductase